MATPEGLRNLGLRRRQPIFFVYKHKSQFDVLEEGLAAVDITKEQDCCREAKQGPSYSSAD